MGDMEAKKDKVTSCELRHNRNKVALLTDHLVFKPEYNGKSLEGEVAEAAHQLFMVEVGTV